MPQVLYFHFVLRTLYLRTCIQQALVYIIAVETQVVLYFHPCILETSYLRTCIHQALVYIIVVETKTVLYFVAEVQRLSF